MQTGQSFASRARAVVIFSGLTAACGGGQPPEDVALAVSRAHAVGDALTVRTFLTSRDQAIYDRLEGTDTLPRLVRTSPELGATVDSARLQETKGDTAVVAVFWTVPNYDGGEVLRSGESREAWAARLPRMTDRRYVRLVRQGQQWRLPPVLDEALAQERHWMPYYNHSLPLGVRARHAEEIVRIADLHPERESELRAFIKGARIADSLTIRLSPSEFWIDITVENPTGVALKRLEMVITDADGVEHTESVLRVPARGRTRGSGFGMGIALPERTIRITEAEAN